MCALIKKLGIKVVLLFSLVVMVNNGVSYAIAANSPSDVYIDQGTNLLMVKKPADSGYTPFVIKGVNWSPATRASFYATGVAPITKGDKKDLGDLDPSNTQYHGFFFDWDGRNPQGHEVMRYWLRNEIFEHYVRDIVLIKEMNANTVRIVDNLGSSLEDYDKFADYMNSVLQYCYNKGIMVIMTVAVTKEDIDSQKYLKVVNAHKNHPAILMWAIGEEWNFNCFYSNELDALSAIDSVNKAASDIKAVDKNHPVCSILLDKLDDPGTNIYSDLFSTIINRCSNIDIWGVNVDRGKYGLDAFLEQWPSKGQPKPVFISKFGVDSFYTEKCRLVSYTETNSIMNKQTFKLADDVKGYENEQGQADTDVILWDKIKEEISKGKCLGGVIYEFNDALWKVGNYHIGLGASLVDYSKPEKYTYDQYNDEGFILGSNVPTGIDLSEKDYSILNEEHFGLVTADRVPKLVYSMMKDEWAKEINIIHPRPPIVRDDGMYIGKNTYGSVQLEFHWSIAGGDIIDEFQYKITEGSPNGMVISDWHSVGLSDWVIAGVPSSSLVNGKAYYCSVKAINKAGEAIGYSDGITVDTGKPFTYGIQILDITPIDSSTSKVQLRLNAVDSVSGMGPGAQVMFSNNNCLTWTTDPYADLFSFNLKLRTTPGITIVYFKFKDVAGNESDVYSVNFPHYPDKTPPQITNTPMKLSSKSKYIADIIFTADVTDSESGVESVMLCWKKRRVLKLGKIEWIVWSTLQKRLIMTYQGNNTYKTTLYSTQTKDSYIKYYIEAKDKSGNSKRTGVSTVSLSSR